MEINVLQLLEEKKEAYTSAQCKVADYILKNPTEIAFLTVEQVAGLVGVSVATVMRLMYTLGYKGYTQFQRELQELLRSHIAPSNRLETNIKKIGKNKLLISCAELQINNIRKTVEVSSEEVISQAFSLLSQAKKIYVLGVRNSLPTATFFDQGLNRIGIDCEMLIPDTSRLYGILAKMSEKDLVIAISLPRYAKRTTEIVQIAKERGARVLAITDGYSSPLVRFADVFLPCVFDSLSFQYSQIAVMFLADFLITGLSTQNSQRTKQQLQKVEDVITKINANVFD